MWRLNRFLAKIHNLLHHSHAEQELARELASHLALIEDDLIRRGMDHNEARLAARRVYGGIEQAKELHRDERSVIWLEQTLRDIRYGCRNLARNPGFSLVVFLTLTLGIGVNATLFSAYNAVALKPLPVADPHEVVRWERWFEHGFRGENQYGFSYPEYAYCRDHNTSFSSLIAASWPTQVLTQTTGKQFSGEPEMAAAQFVSRNYFTDLGVPARLGRTFLPRGNDSGEDSLAVISYPFWQRRFLSDPDVLGKVIKIDRIPFTVIGIAPEQFTGTSTLPQFRIFGCQFRFRGFCCLVRTGGMNPTISSFRS